MTIAVLTVAMSNSDEHTGSGCGDGGGGRDVETDDATLTTFISFIACLCFGFTFKGIPSLCIVSSISTVSFSPNGLCRALESKRRRPKI